MTGRLCRSSSPSSAIRRDVDEPPRGPTSSGENTLRKTTWPARFLGMLTGLTLMGGVALEAQTNSFIFSTYLGGSGRDRGNAGAASGGWSYVVGQTGSPDFPTHNALQPLPPDAITFPLDGFVSVFDPAGGLFYSSYFAVPIVDYLLAVAAGPNGSLYLAGAQQDLADFYAVVARLQPFTRRISYFQLNLGGRSEARGIAVDSQGNVYVTGVHFYVEPIFDVLLPRAFIAKLSPAG